MRALFLSVLIVIFSFCCLSQSWTYEKGGNPFDGEFRTSTIVGKSDDDTYRNPLFVVNNFENSEIFNIYVANIGFFCQNVKVRFAFDVDDIVYHGNPNPSNQKKVLFLDGFYFIDANDNNRKKHLSKFEFLDLIKRYNKMLVRYQDDCDQVNMQFSLSGSSRAINYVYGDKAQIIAQKVQNFEERSEIEQKQLELKQGFTSGPAVLRFNPGGKYIALWNSPGIGGEMVAKIPKPDTVEVLSKERGYFLIETSDTLIGWCNEVFVMPLVDSK